MMYRVQVQPFGSEERFFREYDDALRYARDLATLKKLPIWDPMSEVPGGYEPVGVGILDGDGVVQAHRYISIESIFYS